jgi:Flp pilus assembly protein TadG
MNRSLASLRHDQRGNSFVELALIAPVLAALVLGTVDISRAVSIKVQMEQAAQRSLELAQVNSYSKASDLTTAVQNEAQTAAGSGSSATVTAWLECNHDTTKQLDYDTGSCSSGQTYARYVSVTVTSSFTPVFGTTYFSGAKSDGTVPVTGFAVLRMQ